jgi:hypothetical protein
MRRTTLVLALLLSGCAVAGIAASDDRSAKCEAEGGCLQMTAKEFQEAVNEALRKWFRDAEANGCIRGAFYGHR